VAPPSDISRTKSLIRLLLNQIGRRLTDELHPENRGHRVLLMLDEFLALGRLDFFKSASARTSNAALAAQTPTSSACRSLESRAYGGSRRTSFAISPRSTA